MLRYRFLFVLFCTLTAALTPRFGLSAAQDPLTAALARMDEAAARFRSLSANLRQVAHVEALHEDNTDVGAIKVKRSKPKDLRVRIDIEGPNQKHAVVNGTTVNVYYPNNPGQIDRYDLGRQRSLVDQFLTLGFGGNSRELQSVYAIRLGGQEVVAGEKTTRLELTPLSQAMLEQYNRIDLWVSDKGGYAVQQKFYQKGRDHVTVTYTNIELNPMISDAVFKLEVPKGTKTETVIKR